MNLGEERREKRLGKGGEGQREDTELVYPRGGLDLVPLTDTKRQTTLYHAPPMQCEWTLLSVDSMNANWRIVRAGDILRAVIGSVSLFETDTAIYGRAGGKYAVLRCSTGIWRSSDAPEYGI